jgi:hypothetical protein
MTQKSIGPSFVDELTAHGGLVGEHFSWDSDGNLYFFEDTPAAVAIGVEAVYAAHDPSKQSWSSYRSIAKVALDESDTTIMRCYENALPVPLEWAAYRKALRAIVGAESGDATKPLSTRPQYPSGT